MLDVHGIERLINFQVHFDYEVLFCNIKNKKILDIRCQQGNVAGRFFPSV